MRKALKGENNKVRMVRDKLYINDSLYDEKDKKFEQFKPKPSETRQYPWNRPITRTNNDNISSYQAMRENPQNERRPLHLTKELHAMPYRSKMLFVFTS